MPEYHDLAFKGVRSLISEYVRHFCGIFSKKDTRLCCEVTVPSPLFLIMAFQSAGKEKLRFSTDALIAQIVLRSFFLYDRPIDEFNASKRFCGLNRMRLRLVDEFDYLMQFGVLCDECLKCGESCSDAVKVFSVSYPKQIGRQMICKRTEEFVFDCCKAMDIELSPDKGQDAKKQYSQLVKLQSALLRLNHRTDRKPLKGNSFALAQTVQLTVFDGWERVLDALDILTKELECAPERGGNQRIYCFYTPFLQPEIDHLFRTNGIDLMGSAVFLHDSRRISFSLEAMVADWLLGMNVRRGAETESVNIAREIQENDCCAFLTGMYGFDRWMGSAMPVHRQQLSDVYGIPTFALDIDFWREG